MVKGRTTFLNLFTVSGSYLWPSELKSVGRAPTLTSGEGVDGDSHNS